MSLSTLNSPPLVTTAGITLGYALPFIEDAITKSPWKTVRIVNLLSYTINIIAVSRPGRMDGEAAGEGQLSPINGRTLVAPAGWAFAIWGPIFLGEAIGVASQFLLLSADDDNTPIVQLLKQTSGPFITAQLFQSLWCAAFRPKYNNNNNNNNSKGYERFVSVGMLSATAYSLSRAHSIFTSPSSKMIYSSFQYGLYFLPMALHFGWTTAASIVNLNGAISMKDNVKENVIAFAGHTSVIAATVLGVVLAFQRDAPVYSGVIAWALSAVADSMKKRLLEGTTSTTTMAKTSTTSTKLSKKKGTTSQGNMYGASTQYILSKTGAIVNAAATSVIAVLLFLNKDSKTIPTP